MQAIYKSEWYEIELHNPQHAGLVVTFDAWSHDKAGFAATEPMKIIAESNLAELKVKTRDNDWYQSDELEEMMRVVSETASGYETVINYGSSMGGFAAALFSLASRASQLVVISPQFSIDRALVPFETRWEVEAEALRRRPVDLRAFASAEITGLVVFDPTIMLDRLQAEALLSAFPRLTALKLSFGGHPAFTSMHEGGVLGNVGREVVNGRATAASIRAQFNASKRQSPRYWFLLGTASMERRPVLAKYALRQVFKHSALSRPGQLFRAGARLSELGDHSKAGMMREIFEAAEVKPHWWRSTLLRVERKATARAKKRADLAAGK